MLREGLDVYVPLVDDHAVDAIVKLASGSIAEVQIKARSRGVVPGDGALFAAIPHEEVRQNYWFLFWSERLETMWLMTSAEFVKEAVRNKTGKNAGLYSIWFNGTRSNRTTGKREEYVKERFLRYVETDFRRLRESVD